MDRYKIEPYTKAVDEIIGRVVVPEELSEGTDGLRYINSGYAWWCALVAMEIDKLTGEDKCK